MVVIKASSSQRKCSSLLMVVFSPESGLITTIERLEMPNQKRRRLITTTERLHAGDRLVGEVHHHLAGAGDLDVHREAHVRTKDGTAISARRLTTERVGRSLPLMALLDGG